MTNFGKTRYVGKNYFYILKNKIIRIGIFRVQKGWGL